MTTSILFALVMVVANYAYVLNTDMTFDACISQASELRHGGASTASVSTSSVRWSGMGHLTLRDEARGALYYNGAKWVADKRHGALVGRSEALEVKVSFPDVRFVLEYRV